MQLTELDEHGLAHHGLVIKASSGIGHTTWYRYLERGHLQALYPGVARLVGTPRTYAQLIAAAVWALGDGALASHRSALHLHGVPIEGCDGVDVETPVDVIVPVRSRQRSLDGVIVHRPTDTRRLTPQRSQGIRCTNALRSIVDLGAVAPDEVSGALGHLLSTRAVSLDAVATALAEHGRRGRAGVGPLRSAFDDWAIDGRPADSVLETAFARLVRRFDLPPFEFHPVIAGWEVDFRLIGTNIIVECDGWTTHGLQRDQFERDRRRDDDLAAAGWHVRRFTYRAITLAAADTARRIRRMITPPT